MFRNPGSREVVNTEAVEDINVADPFGDVPESTIEEELAANPEILERAMKARAGEDKSYHT